VRLIIAGSRGISGCEADLAIREALINYGLKPTEIISGGAKGVDDAAERYAHEVGIDFVKFPANWNGKGKAAGYRRNQKMAWYAKQAGVYLLSMGKEVTPEYKPALLAIWDGRSAGTEHMINIAEDEGIEVFVYRPKDEY